MRCGWLARCVIYHLSLVRQANSLLLCCEQSTLLMQAVCFLHYLLSHAFCCLHVCMSQVVKAASETGNAASLIPTLFEITPSVPIPSELVTQGESSRWM